MKSRGIALFAALALSGCTTTIVIDDDDGGADLGADAGDDASAGPDLLAGDAGCTSTITTCADLCGRVKDGCTGKTNQQLGDDAHAKNSVECGVITNGCGGAVDCSTLAAYKCGPGKACGVRGVGNRCEPYEQPLECLAAGFNCGDLPSACGGMVHCGDCGAMETCNKANGATAGVCGPLCVAPQKSCSVDYANPC